jgi:hypothetical protein
MGEIDLTLQDVLEDERRILAYRAEQAKLSRQQRMFHRAWLRIAGAAPLPSGRDDQHHRLLWEEPVVVSVHPADSEDGL